MDFIANHIFTIIIFVAPLIYSIQPLLLSKINVINNAYDKDLLKRKKIILYRQIKELEMEFDIGNLNKDDFLLRRSEIKAEVSEIIASIKKKWMLYVKNICKSFNRLSVLDGISFTQNRGEIIALMGKNGSGKSTLLRIIARIMKADSGTVAFKEKNMIADDSIHRQNILYIGHDPGLYSFFSPRENLRFLLSLRSLTSKEKYIEEKLDRYGLIDFIDNPIAVFSRGMLQKLKLVQIDLINPDLLLFDEPYSSLDEDGILLVDQLIAEIKIQNKSAILVLHDNQKAKIHGDRILRLESGSIF